MILQISLGAFNFTNPVLLEHHLLKDGRNNFVIILITAVCGKQHLTSLLAAVVCVPIATAGEKFITVMNTDKFAVSQITI